MKKFIISIIVICFISFSSCGIVDGIFNEFKASGFVLVSNLTILGLLERNIACYYNQNNKFPLALNEFKHYVDSSSNKEILFSKLELDSTTNVSQKYNFEILPFTIHFEPDSPKTYIDSIQIIYCNGNILFSDSLLSDDYDSLIVKTNIFNIEANVYDKGESVYYNNETGIVKTYISKPFVHKISLGNSCIK